MKGRLRKGSLACGVLRDFLGSSVSHFAVVNTDSYWLYRHLGLNAAWVQTHRTSCMLAREAVREYQQGPGQEATRLPPSSASWCFPPSPQQHLKPCCGFHKYKTS